MARIERSSVIDGVVVVTPEIHRDERGVFLETYRREWFPGGREMVQANRAERVAGTVVGLHFHLHQADHWSVARGRARVVLHDLRADSPTCGATLSFDLGAAPTSAEGEPGSGTAPADEGHDNRGVYIPPGVAHGFAALTDVTITYLVDATYDPDDELGVAWDDPEIGADWGVRDPVLSGRDQANPRRAELGPVHAEARG